ncbi:MAG TPA: hypothetical protein VNB29_07665, partial [Chthoniobacterales bacterium]|nr:hypothetical protein [Chthoniobacterales bacterium]
VADNCRELDPTREWISGDGSKDMDGRFPVYLEHYGSVETYLNEKAATGKPYGVGEACIAYYAKPRQSEMYVGDRAYRSYADHSDAIAIDAFELLKVQRGFSVYCSIWNAGYYGVEPLPLGQADTSKPPTKEDGVFLTASYVEGKPGAQPERIPPYLTQYNPGYDPSLPLYKPLPLYYAVKAAYQPTPAVNPWDHRQAFETPAPPEIKHPTPEVLFIGRDDGDLFFRLKSVGLPLVADSAAPKMILVDCATASIDEGLAAKIKAMVEAGATAIFWGLTPENQSRFAAALPAALEVFDRPATSLVKNEGDDRVASIRYRNLYFTENTDAKTIMRFGLRGDFVKKGKVLLEACPVDWAQDNTRGMIRSERENPAGACFVEMKRGAGAYIASTIDLEVVTPAHARVLAQLFTNLGVKVRARHVERGGLLDQTSGLVRALVSEPFAADRSDAAMKTDFLGGEATIKPEFQMKTEGRTWSVQEARDGSFSFARPGSTAGKGVVYLSFWIQCPQPLNEILADPNVPQVGLKISAAGGVKLWLNGEEKFASAATKTDSTIEKLPLVKGWNHFLVKVVSSADGWRFAGRLLSKNFELLAEMKSALNPFSEQANFYTIEHTDPEINYEGAWGLEGDGWYQSFTPGDKARFKFYGTGVSLTGRVGPDGGKARLSIDGKVVQ